MATTNYFPALSSTTVAVTAPITGDGSGGSPLAMTAASAAAAGSESIANFNKLATVPTGVPVMGTLESAVINLLATSSDNAMTGTIAGRYFVAVTGKFVVTALDGTMTTGPTTNIGNNAAKTNLRASSANLPSAATLNTAQGTGVLPAFTLYSTDNAVPSLIDATTSFKVDITAAATPNTATACAGKFVIFGYWTT